MADKRIKYLYRRINGKQTVEIDWTDKEKDSPEGTGEPAQEKSLVN